MVGRLNVLAAQVSRQLAPSAPAVDRETLSGRALHSPAAQPVTLAGCFCLEAGPVLLIAQGKGLMEVGALWRRGTGATVMLVRPLDTQLWSPVNEASSWPGHAVCGVSTQGAHGLGAVTEAGISGLRAERCRSPGLKAHSSAAAFRGEVILPGTSCLRCRVFLKDYHGI